ncbi:chitobiosyldiphosphodolichol beta-1,4 mannosyltransferase [Sugiyamaella lignohabitans]|uniref:Chitobiosyldiphosphodolichol beta-mannosyltransferase n=1 Tax=Sugiyamaella lignohabitans TaxID=796027 RepID=A0A167E973_9ASCO|nr:chitobiosyldiphosphodolichol beta-1,4 mannosyltransferase [Sugiyamaella lignohabitans]ANB13796.1 chitobiosyldiphosphodolichol beta-1,4 mannosyltransferase [Sugiyamaella lignohabitans]
MNYHALSIAKCGYEVDLCGYKESKLMDEVIENPLITVREIPVVKNAYKLPFVLFAPYKVVKQHWILYDLLKQLKRADFLLVQNPPSIPVLGMVRFFSLFMSPRTKVIIDWHNLGYSILALKFPDNPNHPFVKIYKWYENWFGYRSFVHLTVTVALGQFLRTEFAMNAKRIIPLYDRPASQFSLLSESQRKEIISKYQTTLFKDFDAKTEKILVTSTSYTPDEDLTILLEALEKYSLASNPSSQTTEEKPTSDDNKSESKKSQILTRSSASTQLPPLRVIITGKGPMFKETRAKIDALQPTLHNISIHTTWLPIEDYPKVLGAADLGISLHQSSSGWDLPMKIVDMFGCGVPVISLSFPAISELVKHSENGLIVDTSTDMAKQLAKLFTNPATLNNLKRGAVRESRIKWDTNWTEKLGPLFGVGQYREPAPGEDDSSSSDDD